MSVIFRSYFCTIEESQKNTLKCSGCRLIPWVGTVEEHHFQSLAMLEDVVGGQDSRSGFVEAADLSAIAAVGVHMNQSAPKHRPEGLGGEAGQWGMGRLKALHDHLHCSEGMPQQDIQKPGSRGKTDICIFPKVLCFFRVGK